MSNFANFLAATARITWGDENESYLVIKIDPIFISNSAVFYATSGLTLIHLGHDFGKDGILEQLFREH